MAKGVLELSLRRSSALRPNPKRVNTLSELSVYYC